MARQHPAGQAGSGATEQRNYVSEQAFQLQNNIVWVD